MLSFPDEQKTYVSMWWQANDDVIKPMHFGACHGRQTQDLPLVGFALYLPEDKLFLSRKQAQLLRQRRVSTSPRCESEVKDGHKARGLRERLGRQKRKSRRSKAAVHRAVLLEVQHLPLCWKQLWQVGGRARQALGCSLAA